MRTNKTKSEIVSDMKSKQKVEKQKALARKVFPLLKDQKSIYDAQTVLNAVSGFIKDGLEIEQAKLRVGEVEIDLSKEKKSVIKTAVEEVLAFVRDEKAKDTANLLEKLGNAFAQFGASKFLKGKMSEITIKDIVAD